MSIFNEKIFDFDDDDNIRKYIVDKMNNEKNTEEKIKLDLEKIKCWFEIESQVLIEKEKILRKKSEDLSIQRKQKMIDYLNSLYGISNVEKIKRKYNIRI